MKNFINLINFIKKDKQDDFINIIDMWIYKKNITSINEFNSFIKMLYYFVLKVSNNESFESLYKIISHLSNNSGIIELLVPLCFKDFRVANDFINYYNKTNNTIIDNCLDNIGASKNSDIKRKLELDINKIGPFYVNEINNFIKFLNKGISFNKIYQIYLYLDLQYNFFNDILDHISDYNIRYELFREFVYFKKSHINNEIINYHLINYLKKYVIALLKLSVNFQDIIELFKVKELNYNIIMYILNYVSLHYPQKGIQLKNYFKLNFYNEQNSIPKIYIKQI